MTIPHYDVFLSRKNQDAHLAKEVYDFLTGKGLRVFDSEHSLPELGNADYQKAIDYALDSCKHMIVVGSSVENITSSWVEAEWRLFINEKRSGYKAGNILSVVSKSVLFRALPASLRYYEVVVLEKANFERILAYVKAQEQPMTATIKEKTEQQELLIETINSEPIKKELEEWYENGWNAKSKEKYGDAEKWYLKAAEQGHIYAQYDLGYMYENGTGLKKNLVEAVKWYKKAAEQGHIYAQYSLGWMYNNGSGVEKNEVEAVKWFRIAAEQGYVVAQYKLGRIYENGYGVEKNEAEAVKWYRKAADRGDVDAQNNLGEMYASGRGVTKNEVEALDLYLKSAVKGNFKAQYNLGEMYSNGRGAKKNEILAINWYRKAAEQGYVVAQFNLGHMYDNGIGVEKNKAEAVKWYRKAAQHGYKIAQNNLKRLNETW